MPHLSDLCKRAIDLAVASGASQVEAVAVRERSITISIEKDGIKDASEGDSSSLAVRLFLNKSMGISMVTPATLNSAEASVKKALSLARTSPPDEGFVSLPQPIPATQVPGLYDAEIDSMTSSELIKNSISSIKAAKDTGSVDVSGGSSISVQEFAVANSLGIMLQNKSTSLSHGIYALTGTGDEASTGFDYFNVRIVKGVDFERIGRKAAEKALKALGAKKPPSGDYALIVDERTTMATVSSIIGMGASAYEVMRGSSYYMGRTGSSIASPQLTVRDDPLYPEGISSSPFDDEGYPCEPLLIVDRGVLQSYYTDSYTAAKLGLKNNGRASRADLGSRPRPALTNIQLDRGDLSEEELFRDIRSGLFVYDSYLGPVYGTSNISSLVANGFLVENGELRYSIKDTMVGSTVFDLLQGIDGASKEVLNESGHISPKLRIKGVRVTSG